jgi:hypothetical protein
MTNDVDKLLHFIDGKLKKNDNDQKTKTVGVQELDNTEQQSTTTTTTTSSSSTKPQPGDSFT